MKKIIKIYDLKKIFLQQIKDSQNYDQEATAAGRSLEETTEIGKKEV